MTSSSQAKITDAIAKDNLVKLMLKLTPPGIIGMLLISLNNFIDVFSAGRFIDKNALAAISLALPLTSLVIGFALFVGVGSASVLSRSLGSGDVNIQAKIFGNFTLLSVIISFFLTILGYIFSQPLINFMGGSGEIADLGVVYFQTYVLGSLFFILAIGSSQLIKAEGKIPLATIFSAIYVFTNITLNLTFVLILNWGVRGIAFATVISAFVYTCVNWTYFLSGKSSIQVNLKRLAFANKNLTKQIISVGSSVILMHSIEIVQLTVIYKSIAHYGSDNDLAFVGATLAMYSLITTPLYGFVQALHPVIGINYGGGFYERVKKAYLTFSIGGTILSTILWLPLQFYPQFFLSWLLPNFDFTATSLLNFRIVILLLPLISFIWCSIAMFQAMGKGKIAGILIVNRQLILFVPVILFVPIWFGVNGVYYSLFLAELLAGLLVVYLTFREFIKLKIV
ncbi:MAG: MATE family efflux transporter [Kamptonema sp. SIO1D9]|nr:MATE family efflux transporter [Kamptonema sp. SIO1D9]